tara:strand:+ start:299 stop:730 length:432 start_codon:yes stop_codon:yes gene_type:complete
MIKLFKFVFLIFVFFISYSHSQENYFKEAKSLYEEKKYDDSKFLFERNIVFNPKDSKSYLYLAKIFEYKELDLEVEKNLNTALLLDPKNEEALYMMIDLELKKSNFSKVKELLEKFEIVCFLLCNEKNSINERLKNFKEKEES